MAKKGVAKIIGNQSPMVGEKQIYRIESWYPDTPLIERNPQNVTWELFKKRKNGIFTTTNIKKKGIGEFTFGEIAQKHTYLLEAYLYVPEGKGIIINPQPSKIPKINKVELFYLNGNKGQVFSFTEKFIAKAYCVNLEGKELKFTLWEDDEKGNGHSEKNLIVETKKAKVDSKGVAKVDFQLTKALIQKAQSGEVDARELEFYVTVEYYAHKKHATENIHIKNPEIKKETPKRPQGSKISKAPNSPASKKGESKKVEKGILDSVEESLRKIADFFSRGETRGKASKDKKPTENKPQSNKTVGVNVKEKKESTECFCKKKENRFYWSDKLTCKERKKVLEVCSELWGEENKSVKASELMSIIHLESAGTFSPSADNRRGYSGLIQFSDVSAKSLGTTRSELKKMSFVEQMDYVKRYFERKKDLLNTMMDLYLLVMKPSAVGQGKNKDYAIFDESVSVPDGDGSNTSATERMKNINKEPWVTKYGYSSNPSFMLETGEKKKRKKWVYTKQQYEDRAGFEGGKTYIWEVEKVLREEHYDEGKLNVFNGVCEENKEKKEEKKTTTDERAPWMKYAVGELKSYGGIRQNESPLKEKISKYFDLSSLPSGNYSTYWCASFVNWCFEQTKDYKETNSMTNVAAFDWLPPEQAKLKRKDIDGWKKGELIDSIEDVFYGAVIVFSHSHVAFVMGETEDGKSLIYIGGNQSDGQRGDGPGKRTISTNPILKSKFGKTFWLIKPKGYSVSENEKKLDKLTTNGKELDKSSTR